MTYPFSEQATVVSGEVRLTDESTGQSTLYKAGDSWFVSKGTPVLWEVADGGFVKHYYAVARHRRDGEPLRKACACGAAQPSTRPRRVNNRSRLSAVKPGVTAHSACGAIRPTRQAVPPGGAAQPSTCPRRANNRSRLSAVKPGVTADGACGAIRPTGKPLRPATLPNPRHVPVGRITARGYPP